MVIKKYNKKRFIIEIKIDIVEEKILGIMSLYF